METVNRLENLVSDIIEMGASDDMMLAITEVLTDTETVSYTHLTLPTSDLV